MKISPRLSEMDNTKSSESLDEQIEASNRAANDDVIEDEVEIQDGTPRDIGPVAPMVCDIFYVLFWLERTRVHGLRPC